MQPCAPSMLRTPAGVAHIVIGSLASGRPRYQVNGAPIDLDVTIPPDLAGSWWWFGSLLVLDTAPGQCGLSICANIYPPPVCFEMARDWLRRERAQEPNVVQESMF